jgi:virginiamycin B lyase
MSHKAEIVELRFDLYGCGPAYITVGGQQSLWVTCETTMEVVGLLRDGSLERYPVEGTPHQIALGGESIWFSMPGVDEVGRIDHAGEVHNYSMAQKSCPVGVATHGDQAWLTLSGTAQLARLDVDGRIDVIDPGVDYDTNELDPTAGAPEHIVFDRMGDAWVTFEGVGAVVRVPVAAEEIHAEVWTVPDHISPRGIAVDDAAAWIADHGDGGIWRIDRAVNVLERVEAWPKGFPSAVTSDRSGGIWFSEPDEDLVGHMDADGRLAEYDVSDYGAGPLGLAVDDDGIAWTALHSGGVIGLTGGTRT